MPHVVSAIRSVITNVIAAGASTVVVPGMIPLGCEPQLLTLYRGSVDAAVYDRESGCITRLNGLAQLHNRELRRVIAGLRRAHPGATIVYADLYRAVTDIIVSPREYGAHRACTDRHGGRQQARRLQRAPAGVSLSRRRRHEAHDAVQFIRHNGGLASQDRLCVD